MCIGKFPQVDRFSARIQSPTFHGDFQWLAGCMENVNAILAPQLVGNVPKSTPQCFEFIAPRILIAQSDIAPNPFIGI